METLGPGQQAAVAQTIHLGTFGGAVWWWLRSGAPDLPLAVPVVCALPAFCAVLLSFTSNSDPTQYALRIMACGLFGPILLLFWSTNIARQQPVWPFATAATVLHAAAFVGFVMWAGGALTRVTADPSSAKASGATLAGRLLSVGSVGAPFDVESRSAGEIVVWYRYPEGEERSHAVILNLDQAKSQVRVRERVSANGARPKTAEEASLRGPAAPYQDPARPRANRVYGTVAQTSPIDPARLRAMPVTFTGNRASLPAGFAPGLDEDGMVTLLCAVTTRSGWDWQPGFFGKE